MRQFHLSKLLLLSGLAVLAAASYGVAAEKRAHRAKSDAPAEEVEMFAAMKDGSIEVEFIGKSDKEANVILKNKSGKPLTVRLPEAFAGVPALAQIGGGGGRNLGGGGLGGGGGRNAGGGGGNNQNQNQGLGGGFGGGGGGLGGGGLGGGGFGGGGAFNIRPEQVAKLEVACVCLEHGKEPPRAKIRYEIRPIGEFTENANVHELIKLFATGEVPQKVAQAAAWHLANEMSWEELAAEAHDHIGRPDEPMFTRAELEAAFQLVQMARTQAEERKKGASDSLANADTSATAFTSESANQGLSSGK